MADAHSITSKKCSKCGEVKPISDFSKRKNTLDGLRPNCRSCASAEYKAWVTCNKERKAEYNRQWRSENVDLVRESWRDWHAHNAEASRQRAIDRRAANPYVPESKDCPNCKQSKGSSEFHRNAVSVDGLSNLCRECAKKRASDWYLRNRDRAKHTRSAYHFKNRKDISLKRKIYRAKNIEREAARAKAYRDKHKEEKRARDKAWQQANPDRMRIYKRVSQARRRKQVLNSTEHYSSADVARLHKSQRGKCACCKTSLGNGYHIDHVVPLSKGGGNGPFNIQLLCPTCNLRKNAKDPIEFMQENGFLI